MDLNDLPLELLLALQEAMTDPSEEGQERARLRAADAGYFLVRGETVEVDEGAEAAAPPAAGAAATSPAGPAPMGEGGPAAAGEAAPPRVDPRPVEAPEAPEGVEAEFLSFGEE